jgi:hypothetical protein
MHEKRESGRLISLTHRPSEANLELKAAWLRKVVCLPCYSRGGAETPLTIRRWAETDTQLTMRPLAPFSQDHRRELPEESLAWATRSRRIVCSRNAS